MFLYLVNTMIMIVGLSLVVQSVRAAALTPQKIHVIVNPYGGGGAGLATLETVLPAFEAAGIAVTTLVTEYAGHAGEYAKSVPLLDGLVGIGGDGTAHEIANGMLSRPADERVPIGIIPSGSGNTWAFDLGFKDAVTAVKAIVSGDTQSVDVMAIGAADDPSSVREYAINIAGFGMPAAVLEVANDLRWLGSAQYELAGLVLIATGKTSFGATLELETADGSVIRREVSDFSFAQAQINAHMGKKVCFAPGAEMNDGLLDLCLITKSGGLDILHANALARGAAHLSLPFVELIRCKSLVLTPTRTPGGVDASLNLDGELSGIGPFRAECVPRALQVYASSLNEEPMDTSADLEPQLVLSLVRLLEGQEE